VSELERERPVGNEVDSLVVVVTVVVVVVVVRVGSLSGIGVTLH